MLANHIVQDIVVQNEGDTVESHVEVYKYSNFFENRTELKLSGVCAVISGSLITLSANNVLNKDHNHIQTSIEQLRADSAQLKGDAQAISKYLDPETKTVVDSNVATYTSTNNQEIKAYQAKDPGTPSIETMAGIEIGVVGLAWVAFYACTRRFSTKK